MRGVPCRGLELILSPQLRQLLSWNLRLHPRHWKSMRELCGGEIQPERKNGCVHTLPERLASASDGADQVRNLYCWAVHKHSGVAWLQGLPIRVRELNASEFVRPSLSRALSRACQKWEKRK